MITEIFQCIELPKYFDLLQALTHIDNGSHDDRDNRRYHQILIDTIADNQLAPPNAFTDEELPWYVHIPGSVFVLEWCGAALVVLMIFLVAYSLARTARKLQDENEDLRRANRNYRNNQSNGRNSGGWGSDTTTLTTSPSAPADSSVTINIGRDLVLPPTYNDLLPSLNPRLVSQFATIVEEESADESNDADDDASDERPYPLMMYPGCNHRCIEPVPQLTEC